MRMGSRLGSDLARALAGRRRAAKARQRPYRLRPVYMGGPVVGVDLDKALRLAAALEDEAVAPSLKTPK